MDCKLCQSEPMKLIKGDNHIASILGEIKGLIGHRPLELWQYHQRNHQAFALDTGPVKYFIDYCPLCGRKLEEKE